MKCKRALQKAKDNLKTIVNDTMAGFVVPGQTDAMAKSYTQTLKGIYGENAEVTYKIDGSEVHFYIVPKQNLEYINVEFTLELD